MHGVAGMGPEGMGSASTASTMASTILAGCIDLAAHGSASASGRSGGHTGGPIPTRMRTRRWLWLPPPYTPHPSHDRREDEPLGRGLLRFKITAPDRGGSTQPPFTPHLMPFMACCSPPWREGVRPVRDEARNMREGKEAR